MGLDRYNLSSCMFLLAVVELFNNHCPFLVILGVLKLVIQDFFFFLKALSILLALLSLFLSCAMLMISSCAELLKTLMQEDWTLEFCIMLDAWKYYVDGSCVKST